MVAPGILSSHVIEISLAGEASGTVTLAEVAGLQDAVYFRIRSMAPCGKFMGVLLILETG